LLEIQSVGRDITERKMAEAAREREAAFQRHKAELLISLTTLRKDDADVTIRRVLEEIGDLFGAARIGVWWLSEEKESVTCTNSWFEEGAPQPPFPFTVSRADYQWVFDLLLSGKKLLFRDIDEVPASANELRGFMEKTQIRSYLACPLVVDGEDMGSITIAATRADAWNDIAIGELEILANILATALSRFHASEALSRRAAIQSRLAEISSYLLNVPHDENDEAIRDALALIGNHYGFDRVNVTWYDEALPGFGAPIDWQPDGTTIERADPAEFPYGYGVMLRGGVTRFDAIDEMPAEASIDQATWNRLGLSTVLCLPLVIKEKVFGSATFAYRKQQDWNDQKVEELRLFANIVTNCAVRQWSTIQLTRREKDLERSQRVAKVGSYRLQATFNDDDPEALLNVLNFNMSDQALEIFGVQPQSDARAQVMSTLARIHPDDEPRVRETWQTTLQEGGEHTIEYRVIGPEGSTVHVQAREQFDGTDENGVTTFFGTYKDITEWVEANRELQLALSQIQELTDQLQEENVLLRDEVRAAHGFDKIIGTSSKLRDVLKAVQQVAPTDVTVLICGETGTGKELIAQSIHDLSDRKAMPMVSVNCAALSAELVESELFGHEKGAFTGAHARRKGRFEITNGGTLFLDEIGEMSGDLQAKLLRVIQEGEFERLGGSTTLKTDVRLIAATNRNLVQEMDGGRFRADLYYRINAFPVDLPPLRERKEDIPLLAAHLVRKHAKILGKEVTSMSARMLRHLQEQDWPGNIRELEGTILRALVSTSGPVLDLGGGSRTNDQAAENTSDSLSLLDAQRKHVVDVLEQTRWIIEGKKGAAAALGLAPSSLRSKMKRLNIVRPSRERAS
jgi:PAS domain S-box-containing protein